MTTQPTTSEQTNAVQPAIMRPSLSLRGVSLFLVVVGLLVSGYLSYTRLTDTTLVCLEASGFNCDVVQSSIYAKLLGIPVSYLGFGAYLALGALLALEGRATLLQEYGPIVVFGIALFGFLFSLWLFYVQAALLQSFCIWCLIHDVTMTLLFIVSGIRLRRTLMA